MKLKIGDLLLLLIIPASIFWFYVLLTPDSFDSITAVITKDGQVIQRINLSELDKPRTYEFEFEYYDQIVAEKGRIRFLNSNCPEKICVSTGWLTKPGQIAVCLPNELIIKIEGHDKSEIDVSL